MFNFWTRRALAWCMVAASLALLPCIARAAEKIAPKSFKNVDQAVGWVKAKGKCDNSSEIIRTCRVSVDLPNKYEGKDLSPGWLLAGEMLAFEIKEHSYIRVRISRTRQFRVSANDATATLTVARDSEFDTGTHGKILNAVTTVGIKNYRGEHLFNLRIRLPRPYLPEGMSDDEYFSENLNLLKAGFGLDDWIWESK